MEKADIDVFLSMLEARFLANMARHPDQQWSDIAALLAKQPAKLASLQGMEATGGEPDVVAFSDLPAKVVFCDCAPESPSGRRSLCYDRAALDARKENKPSGNALEMAEHLGIDVLDEAAYRELQAVGSFDKKTSSWIKTPDPIRKLGGALFCDRRYETVFAYHNGAESYYAARGFRGRLIV
jgi:hypothetical protein